jgi:hypothetical protein
MGFPVPTADPGPPLYAQPPDDIRSSTLVGLLERDRFIYAYSRRCLVKVGGSLADTGSPVTIRAGFCRTSSIVTGNVIVVATGFDCTFALQIGANSVTITLGGPFGSYRAIRTGWVAANVGYPFAVSLVGSPGRLYGLSVYEQRLDEADLPA